MTLFGLDETAVRAAAASVRPPSPDAELIERDPVAATDTAAPDPAGSADAREVFARAAWSSIAEPGDGVAGAVVGILGRGPQPASSRASPRRPTRTVPAMARGCASDSNLPWPGGGPDCPRQR
jgi:hypothetical protein